ncbi:MAG: FkbM family methyltransferase [Planctomycetota bacterium]|nr:FkbM family methyltransferase [Planctomycetota bacterium]
MAFRIRPLFWLSPSAAQWIYTVLLRPRPLRALAHAIVRPFIPAQIEVEGVKLALNRNDPVMSGSIAMGCHEHADLAVFRSLLKPGMCVVDIGANIGLYSAVAAKAVGPSGVVVAIEPAPHNFALIGQMASLNGFAQVRPVQAALSDRPGELKLYINADNTGDNRIYPGAERRETVSVRAARLDDLWAESGYPPVDVIKMDIQGAEALAVDGMAKVLAGRPRLAMLMEFWPWGISQSGRDPAALLRTLRAAGFSIHRTDGDAANPFPPADDATLLSYTLERQFLSLLLRRGEGGR